MGSTNKSPQRTDEQRAERAAYMREWSRKRRATPEGRAAHTAHHARYRERHANEPEFQERQRQIHARMHCKIPAAVRMLGSAKERAKKNGLPFNIDLSDIIIPVVCPLLGIPIIEPVRVIGGKRGPRESSPTLDRIRSELGYVKGNVWVISHRANVIKHDATADALERVALHLRQKIYDLA